MENMVLQAPTNSGSAHYSYKGTHSIVLMALVDDNSMFRVIDVGVFGRNSDSDIVSNSPLRRGLREGTVGILTDIPLPGADLMGTMLLWWEMRDEAFPVLRPYPAQKLVHL